MLTSARARRSRHPLRHEHGTPLFPRARPHTRFHLAERGEYPIACEIVRVDAVVLRDLVFGELHGRAKTLIEVGLDTQVVAGDVPNARLVDAG